MVAVCAAMPVMGQTTAQLDQGAEPEPVADPILMLQSRMEAGAVELAFDSVQGWLPSLMMALDVSVASQVLIFSRTSLQTDLIAPWTPRAVYFNDDVYLGWVPESPIVEIAVADPAAAAAFYTLAQDANRPAVFHRESSTCLMCHESRSVTGGPPGFIVRSVLTDRLGYPMTPLHEGSTDDRTPFEERFGGYYVTGSHATPGHAGNVYAPVQNHDITDKRGYVSEVDLQAGGGVLALEGRFDASPYASPHSDLVALLVLTHQTHVHNLISEAREVGDAALLTEQRAGTLSASRLHAVEGAVERLIRSMLFSGEAPLPGPIAGTSNFVETFEARGPFDAQGRSLRQFDLDGRLFRHPLSFLVYSEAFRSLPVLVKTTFFQRLDDVLSGRDDGSDWAHLDEEARRAIYEILEATVPEFASLAR
jgi:hypothetical protein